MNDHHQVKKVLFFSHFYCLVLPNFACFSTVLEKRKTKSRIVIFRSFQHLNCVTHMGEVSNNFAHWEIPENMFHDPAPRKNVDFQLWGQKFLLFLTPFFPPTTLKVKQNREFAFLEPRSGCMASLNSQRSPTKYSHSKRQDYIMHRNQAKPTVPFECFSKVSFFSFALATGQTSHEKGTILGGGDLWSNFSKLN